MFSAEPPYNHQREKQKRSHIIREEIDKTRKLENKHSSTLTGCESSSVVERETQKIHYVDFTWTLKNLIFLEIDWAGRFKKLDRAGSSFL